jgi:type I restriction enzyme S subunit
MLAMPLSNGRSVKDRAGGFEVLRLGAITGGTFDRTARKEGDWNAQEASNFIVREGDFLVARGNGNLALVGRGALVVSDPGSELFSPVIGVVLSAA